MIHVVGNEKVRSRQDGMEMETFQWTCQDIIEGASLHAEISLKLFTITQLHHQIVASPLFPPFEGGCCGSTHFCGVVSVSSALLPGLLQLQHRLLLRPQVFGVNKGKPC